MIISIGFQILIGGTRNDSLLKTKQDAFRNDLRCFWNVQRKVWRGNKIMKQFSFLSFYESIGLESD